MAHFAKIDDDNLVLTVLHVDNKNLLDENNQEQESLGQQHLQTHNNWPAEKWIQTSYNANFRGHYAHVGGRWDPTNNLFWPPKPYGSWVKNVSEKRWQSPIGDPPDLTAEQSSQNNANTHMWVYLWNEDNQRWDLTDDISVE